MAGATHLVTGSVAVIGDRMRIDGQIVAVGDGRVVVAEKIEGERDAFFELALSRGAAAAVGSSPTDWADGDGRMVMGGW